jgi:hypothetical protein
VISCAIQLLHEIFYCCESQMMAKLGIDPSKHNVLLYSIVIADDI